MNKKPTNICLHGHLGEAVGRKDWSLAVSSVGEAMRAIEILSKRRLFKYLAEKDKEGAKYHVLLNGRNFIAPEPLDPNRIETIANSELMMQNQNLETIDIVPVVEGAGGGGQSSSIGAIIVGVVLIIVGIILIAVPFVGAALIVAGIGLIAAGVINLLSPPPKFEEFTEGRKRVSYLFNGPENTTQEGGPVPVGYGRLLIGSHVISASYEVKDVSVDTPSGPRITV
jgi:predicted phage tail protein